MTTRITRIEGERASEMILKLEGVVTTADAKLLEEICEDLRRELDYAITIDMSGVNFFGKPERRHYPQVEDDAWFVHRRSAFIRAANT